MKRQDSSRTSRTRPATLLDYALLGLLRRQPQSGYALRQQFRHSPIAHYSSSPGSIYPALRRLESSGLVDYRPAKRERAKYRLTPHGTRRLVRWLAEAPPVEEFDQRPDAFLLRLAFLGQEQDLHGAIRLLGSYQQWIIDRSNGLRAYVDSDAGGQLPLTGRLAVEFGLRGADAARTWAGDALARLTAAASAQAR